MRIVIGLLSLILLSSCSMTNRKSDESESQRLIASPPSIFMRYIIVAMFLLGVSSKSLANEAITIFVKETSYSVDSPDGELSFAELERKLRQLKFSLVTLDVDYCAGPDMLADAYVAIANANPSVKGIHLKPSGSNETSKCKNV